MVDLVCNTCGHEQVYLQVKVQNQYRPLLICGFCGEAEVVLWKRGAIYLAPWGRFSTKSTESTGPTTDTNDV